MKRSRLLDLMLLLALGVGLVVACSTQPPQFSHPLHLTRIACGGPGLPQCLSCATCHKVAGEGSKLPPVSVCRRCHKPNDSALAAFRPAPDEPEINLARTVHFEHAKHLKMPSLRGQCVPCHGGVVSTSPDTPANPFPDMKRCFKCHEHQQEWDRAQCTPCHSRAKISKVMPQTFLRHDAAFQRHHGTYAREKRAVCQNCHSESQCNDCHDVTQGLRVEKREPDAIQRRFVHRGDWLTVHPIEAKSQPRRCLSCHSTESCDACHVQHGVSGNAFEGANPHPPGWVGSNPDAADFHGRAARRDILTCAGCHDQGPATNCIRCHAVGGPGGNPHPHGWKSARSDNASMCRYCHGG